MATFRKPKSPANLKEKAISQTLREKLEIPDALLVSNYGTWSLSQLIEDYFTIEQNPPLTGHDLYNDYLMYLEKIVKSNDCPKGEGNYMKKFLHYMEQARIKRDFLLSYQTAEREKRLESSTREVAEEVQIAGNELFEENLREERGRRRLEDITNEESSRPIKIQVKEKSFNIQSPSMVPQCNSPLVDDNNLDQMSTRLDICLGTNTNYASPQLLEEYSNLRRKHRVNHFVKNIEGAYDMFIYCTSFNKDQFLDGVSECKYNEYGDSDFNKFMKFSMIDFGVNMSRPTHMPINDERTMFVEVVVQLWKYFGNLTGLASFRWCEKKDKDAATAIFYANQEKEKGYLLDGIGSNENNVTSVIIESSGINITTNIEHALEDSVKNIKSATDALISIISKYPNASINTLKKVHIYSVHTIQNNMTLMRYSWKDKERWTALECGSSLLPMAYNERKGLIQVYEMFAFIYIDLLEQKDVFKRLEDEHLGYILVDEQDLICKKSL